MVDLTKNSIMSHLLSISAQSAVITVAQLIYQFVDLYFITRLGASATAGVSAAGNALILLNTVVQVLGVSSVAIVSQAMGRRDYSDANSTFNQALSISIVAGTAAMALLSFGIRPYLCAVTTDAIAIEAGVQFMLWVSPGFALGLPMVVLSSALRAAGIIRGSVEAYFVTIVVNAILAPVLILGWGTGIAFGVRGAGLATTISVVIGMILLALRFHSSQKLMRVHTALLRPTTKHLLRIVHIGLPSAGEYSLTFLSTAIVFYSIRELGTSSQAGFGIAFRVLQLMLLPAAIVAGAATPVAGQNFGARNPGRVIETFHKTMLLGTCTMVVATSIVQWQSMWLVSAFAPDAASAEFAALFLRLVSWTFVAQACIYTCAGMFQGLGNTMPSLTTSVWRLMVFAGPALWLSTKSSFRIELLWYAWGVSVLVQAALNLYFLRAEFRRALLLT